MGERGRKKGGERSGGNWGGIGREGKRKDGVRGVALLVMKVELAERGWKRTRDGEEEEEEKGKVVNNVTMTFSCILQYCVCKFQKSVCAVAGHYM